MKFEANNSRKIAILIVAYNGINYLEDCLESVFAAIDQHQSNVQAQVFVVDNASTDGSGDWVRKQYPQCDVSISKENLGFTGGNNLAWKKSQDGDPFEFVYLLNQDTIVDKDFLVRAVEYLDNNATCGAVQSLILLHPETNLINTAGNQMHFLGFGLPGYYRQPREAAEQEGRIGFPSGAGVMIRSSILQETGLFADEMFLYLEDADLGLKLHLVGHPPHVCLTSLVFHKYEFSSTLFGYQFLERNRFWILFVYYRWMTLVLLLPAILIMELGQYVYALKNGMLSGKIRATLGWMNPTFASAMRKARHKIQKQRKISDRELLGRMMPAIVSPHLDNWLLTHLANPLFRFYHRMLMFVVRW